MSDLTPLQHEWVGSPPAHWMPSRLKHLFREKSSRSSEQLPPGSISFGEVVKKEMVNEDTLNSYQEVRAGEFLVNPINLNYDLKSLRTALSEIDVRVSPAYIILQHVQGNSPRYLRWLLHQFDVAHMKTLGAGVRQTITFGDMGPCRTFMPPLAEQEQIANLLDEQTARIDALIAEKLELLAALKEYQYAYSSRIMTRGLESDVPLKETSHPELGLVPAHWSVKRLKFLGDVRSGIAKGKDHGERDTVSLPYLRVANVQDGYVDLTDVQEIEVGKHEVVRFLLQPGDVLMNEGGDNDKLGRGTVWEGQIDPCVHQNHVFAVRLADVNLAAWVARFTSTDSARTYFFLRSKQSTNLASINQANVRELPVPMPPDEERQRILEELERTASSTAQLATHVTEHLERLREYRSSLISAAVTGQLDLSTSNKSH